ncbi:MAG: DUF6448 family protein [Candidatus Omnitrophota bacterium]|nr:DUF6448 family protein [Candidatus Omnitrophota bacterium]
MKFTALLLMVFCVLLPLVPASAEKDSLVGPVVKAGQRAIEIDDVRPALVWARAEDEDEIRQAFTETMTVRKAGTDARRMAEIYFLETLVRLHLRAEGRPYAGMEETGPPSRIVLAADEALDKGSLKELSGQITEAVSTGIRERFDKAMSKKKYMDNSVEAGRDYAAAYVDYIRYLEAIDSSVGPFTDTD